MTLLKPRLIASNFKFLEAPKWQGERLWVSDVFDHKVHALSEEGDIKLTLGIVNRPSGLGFLSDGSLIIVSAKDSKLLRYRNGQLDEYADLSYHAKGWLNDFAVDAVDRIYVGDFGYDFVSGEPRKTTSLHRVDPNGSITEVARDVDFPNGSVFINGGKTLLVAETWEGRITAFNVDSRGALSGRRVFAELGNRQPDGICADVGDAVWAGIYNTGEFVRVKDGGEVTHRVQFAGSGISCTIGGPDGHTLFLTAYLGTEADMAAGKRASAIYAVDLMSAGLH